MKRPSQTQRTAFDLAYPPLKPLYTHGRLSSTGATISDSRILLPCNDVVNLLTLTPEPQVLSTFRVNTDDPVSTCAISSDGNLVVVGALSTFVTIWENVNVNEGGKGGNRGKERCRLRPFVDGVSTFCEIEEDGRYVALGTKEGRVKIYDLKNGQYSHVLSTGMMVDVERDNMEGSEGGGGISCMMFGKRGEKLCLVLGLEDGGVVLFDLGGKKAKVAWVARCHSGAVTCVAIIKGKRRIIVGARDKSMSIIELGEGQVISTFVTNEALESIVLCEDSKSVVTGGEWGVLRMWNIESGKTMPGRAYSLPLCVGERHDEDMEDDDTHDERCGIVGLVNDGNRGVIAAMSDQSLCALTFSEGGAFSLTNQFCGNLQEVYDMRLLHPTPDAQTPLVMIASNSSALRVVRPNSTSTTFNYTPSVDEDQLSSHLPAVWPCEKVLEGHEGIVLALDVSPRRASDGYYYAASSSRDRSARLWRGCPDTGDWSCVGTAEGHTDAVGSVALSPSGVEDDTFMVTAAADRTLKYWSLKKVVSKAKKSLKQKKDKSGQNKPMPLHAKWTVLAHEKDVNAVAVSSSGKTIATGSQDRTVKLWNPQNGSLVAECRGHRRGIWSVAFSPSEKFLASAAGDSTVRIWSEEDGACLRTLEGHNAGVLKVLFLSGGSQLATSGVDGLIKVWSMWSGICDATMDAHEDHAWALCSTRKGDCLVSGGADGEVKFWKDVTSLKEEESAQLRDKKELMTQKTQDATHSRRWGKAVSYALELDLHRDAKKILTRMIKTVDDPHAEMLKVVDTIGKKDDSNVKLFSLLKHCRKWCAAGGPSNAALAAFVLRAVFTKWNPESVGEDNESEQRSLVESIDAHTMKHFNRVSALGARARILDYVIESMQR
eukprot:Plantae.Rhodophyta-Hildenbrandia_rubra.ctg3060.p1 GENE.Plantae.Rhodophyta-Hildenbrandia_rubra.ctg3060~~Plantae.Rhodophyta-Hildenbrandia_rubra.ctg3060.p1  ORF type:complete len:884 (-),score=180.11 Plantae.Rhodophyta-Hildenbrandia_rubra.ctg3060:1565-4216(-)